MMSKRNITIKRNKMSYYDAIKLALHMINKTQGIEKDFYLESFRKMAAKYDKALI